MMQVHPKGVAPISHPGVGQSFDPRRPEPPHDDNDRPIRQRQIALSLAHIVEQRCLQEVGAGHALALQHIKHTQTVGAVAGAHALKECQSLGREEAFCGREVGGQQQGTQA
jgi:hypothetical protein